MSATRFSVDMQDIRFVLFEQLDIDRTLQAHAAFAEFDKDTYEALIAEAERIATEVLAPLNRPGDQKGVRFDGEGNVLTPKGFTDAWKTLAEGGWIGISAPQDVGGVGAPLTVAMVMNELFTGAAMAFTMYPGLTGAAARMLLEFGPEGMGRDYAEKLFTGQWAGTMCLTEAGAGTSVGDNRCRATPTDEAGIYHLEGEKIFITGGDHDLTENILHLVLARTPDAPSGSRGLSLFLVPKFLVNEDGTLGERNDAKVVGTEHKMGIHASSTCTLALGTRGTCRGWLLGQEGDGLPQMFHMMNEARIGVAAQGSAIASAAYNYAVAYAKERVQGTSIREFKNADAPRVPIVEHPDVRRMLLSLKVHAETMRSTLYRVAHMADTAMATDDEALRTRLARRVDLLTPVLKGHFTDVGFDMAVQAVQVYGGYGYTQEYPVEQLVRDGKIMSIYEGTNGVQAMDLLGRKMRIENGALFMEWMQEWQQKLATAKEEGFGPESDQLGKALGSLGAAAMHLGMLGMQDKIEEAMLNATAFLRMFGVVLLGLEALEQARVAKRLGGDTPHLKGKLLNLRYYVGHELPKAVAYGKSIQSGDASALDEVLFT